MQKTKKNTTTLKQLNKTSPKKKVIFPIKYNDTL